MASILNNIVKKDHFLIIEEKVTWKDAIFKSCKPLIEDGSISEIYPNQIIKCIEFYGPYVVFDNHIAMPHTQESSDGVLKTGVSLLISKNLIDFGTDKEGNIKQANLIFTVASYDQNEHMQNIKELTQIFNNEELIEALKKSNSAQDIIDADKQYNT